MDLSSLPTTLIGLFCLAAALIISDWVKNKGKNQREDTKVNELSMQTKILADIRDGQEYDRTKLRKTRARVKRIAEQVSDLHEQHLKQTTRRTK